MKSFSTLIIFLTIIFFVFPLKSYAQDSCQPIYGGGQSCISTNSIVINKTVLNPQTNQLVDSLSINDPKYQPEWIPTFLISITNSGNSNISKIDIKDIWPQYVIFGSGIGNFDSKTNTLSFSVIDLAPNETRKYTIIGRIFNEEKIPLTPGSTICVANQVIAIVNDKNVSQDNTQFCIEKVAEKTPTPTPPAASSAPTTPASPTASTAPIAPAAAVTTTKAGFPVFSPVPTTSAPATGPESLALLALIPTGIAGILLIRKSKIH